MIRPERFQPAGSIASDSSCGSSQDDLSENGLVEHTKEPTLQSSPCVRFWKVLVFSMVRLDCQSKYTESLTQYFIL